MITSRLIPLSTRAIVFAVIVGLLVAGCGASSSQTPGSSEQSAAGAPSLLPPAEGKTQYPLTLSTPWGKTVLEKRPERIVAMGTTDVELLVALGATPVATTDSFERSIWVKEALPAEIEEVYDWSAVGADSVPIEKIAASRPDLIIWYGNDVVDKAYSQLAAVAPVLTATSREALPEKDWRTEIQAIGGALDLSDAATAATKQYDEFFANVRAENPEFANRTATFILQYGEEYGTVYASAPGSAAEQMFNDLGFAPNPNAEKFADNDAVSPELVSEIDGDVIIVAATFDGENEAELKRMLTGSELFQEIPAVKAGRWEVFYSTDDGSGYIFNGTEHQGNINWAIAHGGALLGKKWAAEQLVPILRTALKLN